MTDEQLFVVSCIVDNLSVVDDIAVFHKITSLPKFLFANATGKRLLVLVGSHVSLQMVARDEALVTEPAFVWRLTCVHPLVDRQMGRVTKFLGAVVAHVGF